MKLFINKNSKKMVASDIISQILQRYKVLCSKYPQSPQFIPNTKGDSFNIIRKGSNTIKPTQIRISNHGTYIESWVDRNELGDSISQQGLTLMCDRY